MGIARASLRSSLTLLAGALLCAGCVEYGETPFACIKSAACPEGYRCVNQVCRREGAPPLFPDSRADRPRPLPPDAGAPDTWQPLPDLTFVGKEPVATLPDLPAGLTCTQIDSCYGTCKKSDQPCFDACFAKGSSDGKAKMDALEKCDAQASQGPCGYACTYQSQQACYACLDQVCAAQIAACFS